MSYCHGKAIDAKTERVEGEKKHGKRGLDLGYGWPTTYTSWDSPAVYEKHVVHKEILPITKHVHHKEYVPYPVVKHVVHKEPVFVEKPVVKHVVHKEPIFVEKPVYIEKSLPVVYKSHGWPSYHTSHTFSDWPHHW